MSHPLQAKGLAQKAYVNPLFAGTFATCVVIIGVLALARGNRKDGIVFFGWLSFAGYSAIRAVWYTRLPRSFEHSLVAQSVIVTTAACISAASAIMVGKLAMVRRNGV
jgi:hypothetical protein